MQDARLLDTDGWLSDGGEKSVMAPFDETDLTASEAYDLYQDIQRHLFETFGSAQYENDRSRLDHAVLENLKNGGASLADCEVVLMAGSDKARERGIDYVNITLNALY